jgi:Skp family chaperone for outer membrane proteins
MRNQMQKELEVTEISAVTRHAEAIRVLGKRVVRDIVEIGRRLTECQALLDHGEWLPWLEREFGWTDDTALNFMRVHALSKSRNFRDLSLPISGLYLLAAPSTSDEARDEVLDRAQQGEKLSVKDIKRMIEEGRKADERALKERLTNLEKEFTKREEEIRAEYENDRLTQKDLDAAIKKAVLPIKNQLDKARAELDKFRKKKSKEEEQAQEQADKKHASKLHRKGVTQYLVEAVKTLDCDPKEASQLIRDFDPSVDGAEFVTVKKLQRAIAYLSAITKLWK